MSFLFMSITVADFIVDQGLAESFASELFGHDLVGYMVTDFDGEEIATAISEPPF